MADSSITTREEWQGVYESKAGELGTRVKSTKEYLKEIKKLEQLKQDLIDRVEAYDERLKDLEKQGVEPDDERVKAYRTNRNISYSDYTNTSQTIEELTAKLWANIAEMPKLIDETYSANINVKKVDASEKQKKASSDLAEATKKEKEAEDALKSSSPPSIWEKVKFYSRKIARVIGWVMLGLTVLAPLVASAILGTVTTVVGMAVSSLSGGASLALAIFGVYKYNAVKDAHKNDKSKSYKWANKDKAFKKKEKEVATATKNLQNAKVVQEQKQKENEKAGQNLKDLDNVFKQNSKEAYVVRGTLEFGKMFNDNKKMDHLKWRGFFTNCLLYMYIHDRLSETTYNELMKKAIIAKAKEVNYNDTITASPEKQEFWNSIAPPYSDILELSK